MIYLDNAATSYPKPETVYEALAGCVREVGGSPGRGGYRMAVTAGQRVADVRRRLARFFGAQDPARLVFTLNATDALNIAMKGVLEKGDHVVTTLLEHNSVSRPLARMERDGFVSVTRIRPGDSGAVDPDAICAAIQDETKLVAVCQASNVTGSVQPIAQIGAIVRGLDRIFLVDAAQGAGVRPIHASRECIDLLAFSGHKGLMGPPGTGGLVVGERVLPEPFREGGTGTDSAHPFQPEDLPERLEAGTPNTPGILALGAGLAYVESRGPEEIARHEIELSHRLWRGLSADDRFTLYGPDPADGEERTGVVSLTVRDQDPAEVGGILDSSFDIAVRAGLHCAPGAHRFLGTFPGGSLRVSPGPFTKPDEIDALLQALDEIAG